MCSLGGACLGSGAQARLLDDAQRSCGYHAAPFEIQRLVQRGQFPSVGSGVFLKQGGVTLLITRRAFVAKIQGSVANLALRIEQLAREAGAKIATSRAADVQGVANEGAYFEHARDCRDCIEMDERQF